MVDLRIEKSPIPIIWLDTSVLIRMTRIRLGLNPGREIDSADKDLFDIIYNKVRERKLICPQGDQHEEIYGKQKEELYQKQKEFQITQSLLSLGIRFRSRYEINDIHLFNAMKSYIEESNIISIDYRDAFNRDPILELRKNSSLIVDIFSNVPIEMLDEEKSRRKTAICQISELKKSVKAQGITYEQQVEIERQSARQSFFAMLQQYANYLRGKYCPTKDDFNRFNEVRRLLHIWEGIAGIPFDIEGIIQFFMSNTWKAMPINDIVARLWAILLTSDGAPKVSDLLDVDQLAVALVYCQFVLCDRKMRNLIREKKIDIDYNVKVYSISDAKELITCLKEI